MSNLRDATALLRQALPLQILNLFKDQKSFLGSTRSNARSAALCG